MKEGIHPNYELKEVRCSCGNVIKTKTTAKNLTVEICSACHPFFTGTQKLVDTTQSNPSLSAEDAKLPD